MRGQDSETSSVWLLCFCCCGHVLCLESHLWVGIAIGPRACSHPQHASVPKEWPCKIVMWDLRLVRYICRFVLGESAWEVPGWADCRLFCLMHISFTPLAHRGHNGGWGRLIAFVGFVGLPGTSHAVTHKHHNWYWCWDLRSPLFGWGALDGLN